VIAAHLLGHALNLGLSPSRHNDGDLQQPCIREPLTTRPLTFGGRALAA
jgi:hypothetical protein